MSESRLNKIVRSDGVNELLALIPKQEGSDWVADTLTVALKRRPKSTDEAAKTLMDRINARYEEEHKR